MGLTDRRFGTPESLKPLSRPLAERVDGEEISRQERRASPECMHILEGRSTSSSNESARQMQLCMRSGLVSALIFPGI